jgi:hypothetical protein
MHPIIHDELNKARIADFHRQAERGRLARASIQADRMRRERSNYPAGGRAGGVVAGRLPIILDARSAWPGRALAWAHGRLRSPSSPAADRC